MSHCEVILLISCKFSLWVTWKTGTSYYLDSSVFQKLLLKENSNNRFDILGVGCVPIAEKTEPLLLITLNQNVEEAAHLDPI